MVKCLSTMWETWVRSLGQEVPWRKEWQPTPVSLSGEFHGQRSLAGYNPWGRKELDTTEQLQGGPISPSEKKICPECSLEGLMLKLKC